MKKVCCCVLFVLASAFPSNSFANLQSVYFGFNLGWATIKYWPAQEQQLDSIKASGGNNQYSAGNFDLGLYFRFGNWQHSIIGYSANVLFNYYNDNPTSTAPKTYLIDTSMEAVSWMYFPGREIGIGPFLRLDAGAAQYSKTTGYAAGGPGLGVEWYNGVGGLAGLGLSIPNSQNTVRFVLSAFYLYANYYDSRTATAGEFNIGILF